MTLTQGVFLDLETIDRGDVDRSGLESGLPAWDWHAFSGDAAIPGRIGEAQVVISNKCPLNRAALSGAKELQLVAIAATGTNIVDLEVARDFGVTVCNIRDYCSEAVGQHVITLMLNLLTGQPWYRDQVRQGDWHDARQFCLLGRPIREAKGLDFGVIGYGSLGRAAVDKARALGMKPLVAERRGQAPRPGRLAFEEVLQRADVLSLHCPLNEQTRNLIGRDELYAMKADAILINTARGGIVNERDLAEALRAGDIAGAGVDTLAEEPPPVGHPLLAPDIPTLRITPHNAWARRAARQAALEQLAAVVKGFAEGRPLNVVA